MKRISFPLPLWSAFFLALFPLTSIRAQTLIEKQTYVSPGSSYTVPAGAYQLVIKAWGGGGGGSTSPGGGGAFVVATYQVYPGQIIGLSGNSGGYMTGGYIPGVVAIPGQGGKSANATVYRDGSASALVAGAGGGGGKASNGDGGAGGAANGATGGAGYYNSGGVGGGNSGGAGGPGDSNTEDDPSENVGNGDNGSGGNGGNGGAFGNSWDAAHGFAGGGGGGGFGGGGGGGTGSGYWTSGGGGGGGGSSKVATPAFGLISSSITAGSGSVPAGITDVDYPGSGVGYGGGTNSNGGAPCIVILAYTAPGAVPTITSSLTPQIIRAVAYTYTITATNSPTYYEATGLPPGLTLNPTTGVITGTCTSSYGMTYNATIRASNANGTGSAMVVWTVIDKDTQAPTAPTNLVATNSTATSFTLSWTAATDNVGVVGYTIYRNGRWVGETAGTSLAIANLSPGRNYSFTVQARDGGVLWSAPSVALAWPTTPVSTTDTDGDGMPDVWEDYYSLNKNSAADAATSLAGDGISNLQKYLLEIPPNVAVTTESGGANTNQLKVNTPIP